MTKVKIVIIGYGRIGKRHADHVQQLCKLVAVCDIEDSRRKEAVNERNVPVFSNVDDLLAANLKFDLVAVCSPNGLHAKHTIASLRAGYHVLCEKPMALSVHDCGEMIKEAEKANRRLFIVKQNRYNPPVVEVKRLVEEGELGRILSIQLSCFWNRNANYYKNTWKGSKDLDGGILYTQFSHFIDLLYWLIGDIKTVHAYNDNVSGREDIEFEDTSVVCCKFHNGTIGTMNFSIAACKSNMEGSLTILGEKGTVKIGGQYLNELEYQSFEDGNEISNLPKGNPANNYGQYKGSMSNHDKVYENVIEVLCGNGIIATNGFEGLKTVEVINKIYDSNN